MIGQIVRVRDDRRSVVIELQEICNYKPGHVVAVLRKRKARSNKQNAFYWCYLTWVISRAGGNLQAQGHFSPSGLHEDVKAWYVDTYSHSVPADFSTAELNSMEFSEFFEIVNTELMVGFFGVDTSEFFSDYERFCECQLYYDDIVTFKSYMDNKLL